MARQAVKLVAGLAISVGALLGLGYTGAETDAASWAWFFVFLVLVMAGMALAASGGSGIKRCLRRKERA